MLKEELEREKLVTRQKRAMRLEDKLGKGRSKIA